MMYYNDEATPRIRSVKVTIRKRIPRLLILSLVLASGFTLHMGAQTIDQAAIAQALAAQGASGGTAPTTAPAQPTVNALAVPGPLATPAAPATAPVDVNRSPLESMFAGMASSLGTPAQELSQFGYSLFEKPTAPSLASIGDDYVLGPGDSLVLYLWGDPVDIKEISASYTLSVDRNGNIFLPPAGQIAAWGQDLATVRTIIKSMLDRRYKKLEMSLTLATLRQFPVFVSGFAGVPGTVLASGADTILTVLSRAGGIKKTGSLRGVLLTRQTKGVAEKLEIDFYDSLMKGLPIDLRIREGDSLFIPGIGPVAALAGELKRPGIYELKGDTSIATALGLAGGALPSARSGGVTLLRFSESGKTLVSGDLANASFSSKLASDGDFVYFGKVTELLVGQAQVSGPVKYAGRYELTSFNSLKALLSKAQVVAETNLFYGRIYRMDLSGRDKSFAFSPRDVLAGSGDIPLAEFDRVVLYRYDDVGLDPDFDRFADTLVVSGPVKYPGFYLYKEGSTLSGLLSNNALTLDANPFYGEIIRKTASGAEEYFTFSPQEILSGAKDFTLSRLDRVRFVKRGEAAGGAAAAMVAHDFDKFPDAVSLTGQVSRPEVYALGSGLKLSKILTKDQALLDTNLNYAEITRLKADGKNEYVTFRPSEVLDGSWDFDLGTRDVVKLLKVGYAPAKPDFDRFSAAVQVTGPVQFGGLYAWREDMKLSSLLAKAKPSLVINQVYAEIVRPLGGDKFEYLTFSPKEVVAGIFDLSLKARDSVRFYTAVPATTTKLGVETPGSDLTVVTLPTAVPAEASPVQSAGSPTAPAPAVSVATAVGAPAASATEAVPATVLATPSAESPTDLGRFLEVVTVSGAVRYTGPWARTPTLMLSSVITTDQMLEETNLDYAELTRLKADGSSEYATFTPREVLEGKFDLALRARDSIRLVRKTTFGGALAAANIEKFADIVQLTGQVARPEVFALRPDMKLSSLLTKDQVLLDTNLNYAEISRLKTDGKNEYVTFRPSEVLDGSWDFDLGARDHIRLMKVGYAPAKPDFERFSAAVQVTGPVQFGGLYAWREGMKLSSLLALAQPALETNQFYGEIVRPLGGTKVEYQTFAPREIASGAFDVILRARDSVKLYTTAPTPTAKQGTPEAEGKAEGSDPATATLQASTTVETSVAPAKGAAVPGVKAAAPSVAQNGEAAVPGSSAAQAPASTAAASAPAAPAAPTTLGIAEAFDLSRFLEVVTISGAVRYSGPYARTPSLTLASVITPDQMLEETNLDYGELVRLKEDGSAEYRTFAPRLVLEGIYDLPLRARDSIRLVKKTTFGAAVEPSNFEKFADVVQMIGQVARPEVFAFQPGMKLSQVLTKEQILLDTNLNYGEIVRFRTNGRNEYFTFRPSELLSGEWDFFLSPRDLVRIQKVNYSPEKPDFDRFAEAILVSGSVRFIGLQAWRPGMMLSVLQKSVQVLIETNQVYADILRLLSDGTIQIVTFAPREVASGIFDTEISARDRVRYFSTAESIPKTQTIDLSAEGQATPAAVPGSAAGVTTTEAAPGATPAATPASAPASSAAAALAMAGADVAPGISTDKGFYLEVVSTKGVVRYAGPYARTPTLRLSSVVTPDQILQDTNLDYAELIRRKADGGWEYRTFSPREVLSGAFDLPLRAQDTITYVKVGYLPEKPDFDYFGNAFALTGRARLSGLYSLDKPRLLSDILSAEQLLSDTDIYYAEIERWVTGGRTEYLTFSPLAVLTGAMDLRIFPRDIIRLVIAGNKGEAHDFSHYPDTVLLKGTVRYPGRYAWYEGLSLSTILADTDLLIETDSGYAEISRRNSEAESIISFSPSEVVQGRKDVALKPRDMVLLYPKYYNHPVTVSGEVVEPKVIPYFEGIELSGLLRSVKLSADLNSLKAVVTKAAGGSVDVYLEDYLRRQATAKVVLQPGDAVTIKKLLPDEHLSVVMVRGAIKNPQPVEFSEGMRLAEALEAAGGYDTRAYPKGLVLIRKNAAEMQQKQVDRLIAQFEAAASTGGALPTTSDSLSSTAATTIANLQIDLAMQKSKLGALKQLYKEGFGRISLDMPESLAALVLSQANVVLERDDLIFVPTTPTYILVSGEVSDQAIIAYRSGMTVRDAISESGWFSREADLPRVYIMRASGRLESANGRGFLWFRPNVLRYKLNPGDLVVVPAKTVKIDVAWAYVRDSFMLIGTILTSALTAKTLLGL